MLKNQKILFFLLVFLFSVFFNQSKAEAYNYSWSYKYYNNSPAKTDVNASVATNYIGDILSPKINSIYMRQDDTYFYFDFDLEYKATNIPRTSYVGFNGGSTSIFVSGLPNAFPSFRHQWKYNDTSGSSYYTNVQWAEGSVSFGSYGFSYNLERRQNYKNYGLEKNYYSVDNYSSPISIPVAGLNMSGEYYYRTPPYLYRFETYDIKTLQAMNSGGASVSSSAVSLSNDYWHYRYTGTVKVPKNQITSFRYLSFLATSAVDMASSQNTTVDSINGYHNYGDIRGSSIDLTSYTECEHDWQLVNTGDSINHAIRCSKCKWEKQEAHSMEYEYDGILNNLCICGYHKTVKYTIIKGDEEIEIPVQSYHTIGDIGTGEQEGYVLLGYEKYEKHQNESGELINVFIATVSEIDTVSSNYSTIYKAIYTPIKYTFKFDIENNMELPIDEILEDQVFEYGKSQRIKDSQYIKGNSFVGWSFTFDSDIVDIKRGERIYNYTTENNKIYHLYPVYEPTYFNIMYRTTDGTYANGSDTYTVRYNYNDEHEFEKPKNLSKENYFSCYTFNGEEIKEISEIREMAIYQDQIYILDAKIGHASLGGGGGSNGGAPSSDGSPSGKDSWTDTSQSKIDGSKGSDFGPGNNILNNDLANNNNFLDANSIDNINNTKNISIKVLENKNAIKIDGIEDIEDLEEEENSEDIEVDHMSHTLIDGETSIISRGDAIDNGTIFLMTNIYRYRTLLVFLLIILASFLILKAI